MSSNIELIENCIEYKYAKLNSRQKVYEYNEIECFAILQKKPVFVAYKANNKFIPISAKEKKDKTIEPEYEDIKRLLDIEKKTSISYVDIITPAEFRIELYYLGLNITNKIEGFKETFNSIKEIDNFFKLRAVVKHLEYIYEAISDLTKLEIKYLDNIKILEGF